MRRTLSCGAAAAGAPLQRRGPSPEIGGGSGSAEGRALRLRRFVVTGMTGIYIEGGGEGRFRHNGGDLEAGFLARASASELGLLRLRVDDPDAAGRILAECGYAVEPGTAAVRGAGDRPVDLPELVAVLTRRGMAVEIRTVIPCLYQG